MCLTVSHSYPVTLEHPLTVWKVITYDHCALYHPSFLYSPRKTYHLDEELVAHDRYGLGEVEEGFHAYLSLDTALRERHIVGEAFGIVVEFTIPAGSKVYYGNDSNQVKGVVSDTIAAGSLEPIGIDPEEY